MVFATAVGVNTEVGFRGDADGERMPMEALKPVASRGGVFAGRWRGVVFDVAVLPIGLLCL